MKTVASNQVNRVWQRRLLIGLCFILSFEFVLGGGFKFVSGETFFGPSYEEKFVDWGYPGWFRFVVGIGELLGGILLLFPRTRFPGAAGLVIILVGAVLTHIVNQDPLGHSISAPIHLVLTGIVAWATRPSNWRSNQLKTT